MWKRQWRNSNAERQLSGCTSTEQRVWRAAEPEGEVTSSCLDDSSSFLMASCTTYCWLHHCWRKAVACLWIHSCTCSLVVPEHKASSAGEPATVIFGSALVGMLMTGSSTGVGRGWGFGPSSSLRPRERDFLNCFLPFRKMSDNFFLVDVGVCGDASAAASGTALGGVGVGGIKGAKGGPISSFGVASIFRGTSRSAFM